VCGHGRAAVWAKNHLPRLAELARNYRRREREQLIAAYGGECVCCGETSFEFLTIDHTNGDGAAHRKSLGGRESYGSRNFHRWLRENNYPKDGYRLLCYNCNCAIGAYGYCPHVEEVKRRTA